MVTVTTPSVVARREARGFATSWRWPTIWLSRRYRPLLAPSLVLLLIVGAAVAAPVIAPYDPNAINMQSALAGPSWEHPLGTDQLGRDQLSRLLHGGRSTLLMAALATVGTILIGLVCGVVSGYVGGRVDLAISTLLTVLLSLPSLLLTLAILGVLGPGTTSLLIALIAAGWVGHARVFRSLILTLREQVYIEAAVSIGASPMRVVSRHLVPNVLTTVIVLTTLDLGILLLVVSSLSFLGLGVQPPTADWGAMLNDARPYFGQVPLLAVLPGICITAVALTSNLIGDAIRDHVDGHHR